MTEQATATAVAAGVRGEDGERRTGDLLFAVLVTGFALFTLAVVVGGLLAVAADASDGLHRTVHRLGVEPNPLGRLAEGIGDAAHLERSWVGLTADYVFSLFNLGLAGLLLWLRPRDWTARLLAIALIGTSAVFNLQAYAVYEAMPAAGLERWLHLGFHVVTGGAYLLALVRFPDGRLVPYWRRSALVPLYLALTALLALGALRLEGTSRTLAVIMAFGLVMPTVGVASQAYRYRHATDPVQHQQSRLLFWALLPALLLTVTIIALGVPDTAFRTFEGRSLPIVPVTLFRVFQVLFGLIPVALFVGILRYRLWNIDRVISRTLTYGLLAGFVSAVYVGVVVGLSELIGTTSDNVGVSIAATALVAVAFGPARSRLQRLAERIVYGHRATPYEVLSQFSEVSAESVETEQKLHRVAQLLAAGTTAAEADVWLVVGRELRHAAAWPDSRDRRPAIRLAAADGLPDLGGVTAAVAVRHLGELLGALTVTKPGVENLGPAEDRLLHEVAAQAGLLLHNVRLTAQLLDRLEELQRSRQRIVTAQDEGRRRLERNLHDGAQQELVSLKIRLSLATQLAKRGQSVEGLLEELTADADSALQTLRSLAHGIYPPLLASDGLAAALTAQARRAQLPVKVECGPDRYPQDAEAAVYFCCLEAIQNASKYAGDCCVTVTIACDGGDLTFTVSDDGEGFDEAEGGAGAGTQNMTDRVEALGGTLSLESEPGVGTTVTGRIPARAIERLQRQASV